MPPFDRACIYKQNIFLRVRIRINDQKRQGTVTHIHALQHAFTACMHACMHCKHACTCTCTATCMHMHCNMHAHALQHACTCTATCMHCTRTCHVHVIKQSDHEETSDALLLLSYTCMHILNPGIPPRLMTTKQRRSGEHAAHIVYPC
jgi:hypothetical protein